VYYGEKNGMEGPVEDLASSLNDSAIAFCSSGSQNLDRIGEDNDSKPRKENVLLIVLLNF